MTHMGTAIQILTINYTKKTFLKKGKSSFLQKQKLFVQQMKIAWKINTLNKENFMKGFFKKAEWEKS